MSYDALAAEKQRALIGRGHAVVLAIETSCDETACAIVRDGRAVLSNAVHTQIPLHRKYGGVVPELASRNHVERIGAVVEKALDDAQRVWRLRTTCRLSEPTTSSDTSRRTI